MIECLNNISNFCNKAYSLLIVLKTRVRCIKKNCSKLPKPL